LHTRELHSFPTRRSSDLFADVVTRAVELLDVGLRAMMDPIARPGIAADDVKISESLIAGALLRREPAFQQRQRPRLGFEAERSRSEEHTSELQSLAYLVC